MNKRVLLFSCITVLFFAALPLPWFMHVPAIRNAALAWLGQPFSASLSADSCSFGWFTGLACKDVRLLSQDQTILLETSELRGSKGLLSLLLAPGYLGDITLKEPQLTIHAAQVQPGPAPQKKNHARLVSWWNRGGFQLKALRGQIQLSHAEKRYPLLSGITFSGLLENGSLRYTLTGSTSATAENNLQAEGFINAPPESRTGANLLSNTTIVLKPGRIADLPALPWISPLFAGMDGTAAGSCRLVRNVDGSVQTQGALSLQQVLLSALSAEETRLPLEKASLLFDLTRQGRRQWQVQQLQLGSPLISLNARGLLHPQKSGLHASLSLFLPPASEALRSTLKLHPDAQVQRGELQCDLAANGPAEQLPVQWNCGVSDIEARRAASSIVWKKPVQFSGRVLVDKKAVDLQQAQVLAALVSLEANRAKPGETLAITARADLGALNKELSKVLQLPLQVQGRLSLAASRKPGEQALWDDSLDFIIADFALNSGVTELLPLHQLSIEARGTVTVNGARSGALHSTWWPGSLEVGLHDLQGLGPARTGRYSVAGSMLLARLQPLIQHFLPKLGSVNLAGSMNLDLAAQLQGSRHLITSLQAMLNRPVIKVAARDTVYSFQAGRSVIAAGEAAFNTPAPGTAGATAANSIASLQLAGNPALFQEQQETQSFFDLQQASLQLQPLIFFSDGIQLRGGLSLSQWQQERPHYAFHGHGNMDGAILDTLLRATSRMPAGIKLQGPAQLALCASYPGNPLPEAEIAANLDRAGFGQDDRQLFHEEAINLYIRLEAADSSQLSSWDIPEFSVHNPNFWAKGKGFLWDESRGSGMLALEGKYHRLVQEAAQEQISPEHSFQLSLPLQ